MNECRKTKIESYVRKHASLKIEEVRQSSTQRTSFSSLLLRTANDPEFYIDLKHSILQFCIVKTHIFFYNIS